MNLTSIREAEWRWQRAVPSFKSTAIAAWSKQLWGSKCCFGTYRALQVEKMLRLEDAETKENSRNGLLISGTEVACFKEPAQPP